MIKNLNIPLGIVAFSPQRKCGPGAVALASVGASLLGTGATIASQAVTNSSNKRFAANESEKARDWEAEQWQNRFEQQSDFAYDYSRFQNNQAYDSWLGQQQYNSPAYQAQRMLQAGFNPAAVAASPTYGSTGLSPAPSSPPSPAVSAPQPLMSQGLNPVGVSDIGNFIKDVASAAKDNATLKPMVDNILADTENKNLINSYQRIENNLKAQKAPAEIQKAFQDVMKGKVEIAMMTSNKKLYDEKRVTEIFKQQELSERTILNYAQSKKFDAETMNILLEYENFNTLFDKRIEVMNSEINRNQGAAAAGYGSASRDFALAATENELRDIRKQLLETQNDWYDAQTGGQKLDNWIKSESGRAQITATIEMAKQASLITKKEAVELSQALYQYDIRKINQFFTWLSQGVGAYRDAGIGTSAFRGFQSGTGKGAFDPDAGKAFFMDSDSGLLFKAPWSK